jgi:hypothetical protein
MKDLARGNTHVIYESPITYQSKLMTKVKDLEKVRVSRSWYQMKGLTRRNTQMKYESPSTYESKVMTKVKVLKKVKLQGQKSECQGHGIK